jgi:hypothetical protein
MLTAVISKPQKLWFTTKEETENQVTGSLYPDSHQYVPFQYFFWWIYYKLSVAAYGEYKII